VPNNSLTWPQAAFVGILLFVLSAALLLAGPARWRMLAPFAREAGVISLLYSLWQLANVLSGTSFKGAIVRARWIERVQNDLHLPEQRGMENLLLHHRQLAQFANVYYAVMHFTCLFLMLLWLFWRHRVDYPKVRTTIIWFTAVSLLIELIPVAPPRFMPGYIDVAAHYGQSVYGGGFSVDQLSAMPSVHVGWSIIVGGAIVLYSTSRWRWLFLAHPILTVYFVVATENHWWLDGIVSGALVAIVVAGQALSRQIAVRPAQTGVKQCVRTS
jgi:hypothetical protein